MDPRTRYQSARGLFRLLVLCAAVMHLRLDGGGNSIVTDIDLGADLLPEPILHTLQVPNAGTGAVRIAAVHSSCTCLHVLSYPATIPPGGEGKVRIRVLPDRQGAFRHRVSVRFGADDAAGREYVVHGTAVAPVSERWQKAIAGISPSLFTTRIVEQPHEYLISVEQVLLRQETNPELMLVDVRGGNPFQQGRIPRSIALPLYSLATTTALRDKDVVFIGHGYGTRRLVDECRKLRDAGSVRSASILRGGINSWSRAGALLEGRRQELDTIPPAAFHQARCFAGWCMVDVSTERTLAAEALFPESEWIPAPALVSAGEDLRAILSGAGTPPFWVLVFDAEGTYDTCRHVFASWRDAAVFFLEGGTHAYRDFLRMQSAIQDKRTISTRVDKPCESCP